MRAYLAGPRTNVPEYNKPAFVEAAEELRARGWHIISPVEFDAPEDGMTEGGAGDPLPEQVYSRGLEKCLAAMLSGEIDAVIVLPGWEGSRGATLEVQTAHALGKDVLSYPDLNRELPARHPASVEFHRILGQLGALHDKKQLDYGTDDDPFANVRASGEWGIDEWVGAMVRATDKVRRLQAYARRGTLANEGVVDAFNDLAVYAVIARVLYEEGER